MACILERDRQSVKNKRLGCTVGFDILARNKLGADSFVAYEAHNIVMLDSYVFAFVEVLRECSSSPLYEARIVLKSICRPLLKNKLFQYPPHPYDRPSWIWKGDIFHLSLVEAHVLL